LFEWLASTLVETSDRLNLTQSARNIDDNGEIVHTTEEPWIVTGWSKEDDPGAVLVYLTEDGLVSERTDTVESLNQWSQEFVKNRTRAND
jgi:hypothetical protein